MVSGRTLCSLSLLLSACASDGTEDSGEDGFFVASSSPIQGSVDVLEGQTPEFRLNAQADSVQCTNEQFLLVGMDENGELAFEMEVELSFQDEGKKVLLGHSQPFLKGFWYAAMVLDTDIPCRDVSGRPIAPFGVEFFVP